MPRWLQGVLFGTIALGIPGAAHYYAWARLVRDTQLPQPWRGAATVAFIVLFLMLPASFAARMFLPAAATRVIFFPVYVWMGLFFILLVLLVGTDAARLIGAALEKFRGVGPDDPERRLFLARLLGGAVAATTTVAGAVAMRSALGRVEVKEVEVPLARLPGALDGTTLVQLTDLHIGPTLGREFVEQVVAQTNALRPDVVAITGDLVDGPVHRLREALEPLKDLRARHGVYFVTGNHEYYQGLDPIESADAWLVELERLGVRVLRNERVSIGEGATSFDLAGIYDYNARGFGAPHTADLAAALKDRDPARELVLLAHQPRHIKEAVKHGVGLQLSGHTHGGQIWPFRYLVRLAQPYVAGLHREGDTQIYVSRGTGFFGPPMRLAEPAEITKIVLRAPT